MAWSVHYLEWGPTTLLRLAMVAGISLPEPGTAAPHQPLHGAGGHSHQKTNSYRRSH